MAVHHIEQYYILLGGLNLSFTQRTQITMIIQKANIRRYEVGDSEVVVDDFTSREEAKKIEKQILDIANK